MIQIRHVRKEIHRELKSRPALESLSLSDYLLREIRELASRPSRSELRARLASRTRVETSETLAEAVRSERDAR